MRKLILIAAIALASSAAHAGQSRSLSLAAVDPARPVVEQPKAQTAEVPKATQAPAITTAPAATTSSAAVSPVQTPMTMPANQPATSTAATTPVPPTPVATRPQGSTKPSTRHHDPSVEARVIRELHRHGIYW